MTNNKKNNIDKVLRNIKIALQKNDIKKIEKLYETFSSQILNLFNSKKYNEVINYIKQAIDINPNYYFGWKLSGIAYIKLKKIDHAIIHLKKALELNPNDISLYNNVGNLYNDKKQYNEAEKFYKKAIDLNPDYPLPYTNLANLLKYKREFNEAKKLYKKVIDLNPNNATGYNNLGDLYKNSGEYKKAEEYYKKTIKIDPNYIIGYSNLAGLFKNNGKYKEAEEYYQKAILIDPNYAEAHFALTSLFKYTSNTPHLQQLLDCYKKAKNIEDKCLLGFGLAKAYNDIKDYDTSFKYLEEANKLKFDENPFSIEKEIKKFNKIKSLFNQSDFKSGTLIKDIKQNKKQMIFIVGMPRSGTTLTEQIISSHSQVYPCGELEYLNIAQNTLLEIDDTPTLSNALKSIYLEYMQKIEELNIKENIATDKMPHNFKYIGVILEAFPNAKIIHLKRDPIAICWSMYQRYFTANGLHYSFSLAALSQYYKLYEGMMEFWHDMYPGQIYDLDYETLTENQEEETKQLIKYCGLSWENSVLEPHNNKRTVVTASEQQVRQKVYSGSSQAWKKYEKHLEILKKNLGKSL